MDKRFQVFVSSTFTDLQEERSEIFKSLTNINCIPAGMEQFPAFDDEAFKFIKRVIDLSDYYLLIIGGRYGSLSDDGLSFTEKEYDYAVSRGLSVIALLHKNPSDIPVNKTESDPSLRKKLDEFRERVRKTHLISTWSNKDELRARVVESLVTAFNLSPAPGWVRGNTVASNEILTEINDLRKENDLLKKKIDASGHASSLSDIAGLDEDFSIKLSWDSYRSPARREVLVKKTWGDWFRIVSVDLRDGNYETYIFSSLEKFLADELQLGVDDADIEERAKKLFRIQFAALGLISVSGGRWFLTDKGTKRMYELNVVRSEKQ